MITLRHIMSLLHSESLQRCTTGSQKKKAKVLQRHGPSSTTVTQSTTLFLFTRKPPLPVCLCHNDPLWFLKHPWQISASRPLYLLFPHLQHRIYLPRCVCLHMSWLRISMGKLILKNPSSSSALFQHILNIDIFDGHSDKSVALPPSPALGSRSLCPVLSL